MKRGAENEMEAAWYLVHAKPRQERSALINLERQQYRCFLPMARLRKRRGTELVLVDEPLFPRYLFIQLESGKQDFSPIRSTRGVSQLVKFSGLPAKVPQALITLLQEQAEDSQESASTDLSAAVGDRVRVMTGVMAGYEGIFEYKSGAERASVLLDLAGKYTHINLDLDSLDKV